MAEETGTEYPIQERTGLAVEFLRHGRRTLDVFSPTLDTALFNDDGFLGATRRFAREHDRAQIRFLVLVGGRILHDCPNLVSLVQRLSSKIDFRVVDRSQARDRQEFHEFFLIVDKTAVLHQHGAREASIWKYDHAPQRAQVLEDFFDPLWDEALGDPEMRHLSL